MDRTQNKKFRFLYRNFLYLQFGCAVRAACCFDGNIGEAIRTEFGGWFGWFWFSTGYPVDLTNDEE